MNILRSSIKRSVLSLPNLIQPARTRTFATTSTLHLKAQPSTDDKTLESKAQAIETQSNPSPKKTIAELDEELMRKLSDASGDGGASGVEYEDGKPVAQKRSVRNNMFRLI